LLQVSAFIFSVDSLSTSAANFEAALDECLKVDVDFRLLKDDFLEKQWMVLACSFREPFLWVRVTISLQFLSYKFALLLLILQFCRGFVIWFFDGKNI
jgi:hypothetical protein